MKVSVAQRRVLYHCYAHRGELRAPAIQFENFKPQTLDRMLENRWLEHDPESGAYRVTDAGRAAYPFTKAARR